jgi:G3E family GTPase
MNKQDLYEKEEKKIIEKILERINRNYCILKKTKELKHYHRKNEKYKRKTIW